MAQVRITTSSLLEVASQMNALSDQMKVIASDMKSKVNNMNRWNDPRAEQFRQQATMTARQLALHIDNFAKMSDFLKKYAKLQEESERAQKVRMDNI